MKYAKRLTAAFVVPTLILTFSACTPSSDRELIEGTNTTNSYSEPGQPGIAASPSPSVREEISTTPGYEGSTSGTVTPDPGSANPDQSTGRDAGSTSGR